jgi:tRNA dimethylallyltransferase
MSASTKIAIICGPTATGKSRVAVEISKKLCAVREVEIVSADSAALYTHLDIGTAKPTADDRNAVLHHMIDIISPDEAFNAARYREIASRIIDEIHGRNNIPLVCGGTGLYIKALVYGLFPAPFFIKEIRDQLKREAEERGMVSLFEELKRVDPESAGRINKNDRVRIMRALEVYRGTAEPISRLQKRHGFKTAKFTPLVLGLTMERKILYDRIERRVDEMIQKGLVDEVKKVLQSGFAPDSFGLRIIGYKEIVSHLQNDIGLDEAVSLIKRNTRRLAKRQETWFSKVPEIVWFHYPYDILRMTDLIKKGLNL